MTCCPILLPLGFCTSPPSSLSAQWLPPYMRSYSEDSWAPITAPNSMEHIVRNHPKRSTICAEIFPGKHAWLSRTLQEHRSKCQMTPLAKLGLKLAQSPSELCLYRRNWTGSSRLERACHHRHHYNHRFVWQELSLPATSATTSTSILLAVE